MAGQLVLTGNQVQANYKEQSTPLYKHNLFIEALPKIMDASTVVNRVQRYPVYSPEDRKLPILERIHRVQSIANFIDPLPFHIDLESRFSRMIRQGYVARNPLKAEWVRQMRSGFKDLDWGNKDDQYEPLIRSTASGFAIVGPSGSGKTTAIDSILGLYPQVICHSQYNGTIFERKQIVWLKLECPKDGSAKSLCLNFFQSIDRILGTDYFKRFSKSRISADVLLPEMANLSNLFGLGVLVIDEIQRVRLASSGGAEGMMNFLVQLVNTIGVPIVPVGTPRALKVLTEHFSNARRMEGQGDIVKSNYLKDEEWDFFINTLWQYQYTEQETQLTDAISNALYEESYGIIDLAVKLYMLVQWEVIGKEERITVGVIREVAKESLQLVRAAFNKLKNGNYLEESDDIFPSQVDLDKYMKRANERVFLVGRNNTLRNQQMASENAHDNELSPKITIAQWLIDFGIERDIALQCANEALAKNGKEINLQVAMKVAFEIANNIGNGNEKGKKQPRNKKKSTMNEETIKEILEEDLLDDFPEII